MTLAEAVIARYGKLTEWRVPPDQMTAMSNERLLELGEKFLLHHDKRIHKVPLVRLFGPGFYWRSVENGVEIVGQGTDGENAEQWRVIIEGRRRGEIYGKWFSKFCRVGELGVRMCEGVEPISEHVYTETVHKLGARQ